MIDKGALFKHLDGKAKPASADVPVEGAEPAPDAEGGESLAPYAQFIAAVKSGDAAALKEAWAACDEDNGAGV